MKKYKLEDLVNKGSHARQKINSDVIIGDISNGYDQGDILDANATVQVVNSKVDDVLGVNAEGINDLLEILHDDDATTGILTQLKQKTNDEDLATVAKSGSYNDLADTPQNVSVFTNDSGYLTQHQDISGKADKSEMSVTDGTGTDADKTTITLKNGTSVTVLKSHQDISGKQDTLVSRTNIKTINNESILGSGNIDIVTELPSNLAYTSNDDGDGIVPDEYYFCDTAAATVTKTVLATDYVLSTGGSIKIKMIHDNTANDATLNVNNTGAKPLFYADKRASNGNSWKAGEIIEVYYDGTNFYANNVSGEMAEKIKYDNSQSGLSADNVQGAIDEIKNNIDSGVEIKTEINLLPTITIEKGYINGTTGDVVPGGNTSPYRYTSAISVQEGQVIYTIYSGNNTMGIAAYNNEIPVVDKSVVCPNRVIEAKYVVPEGVDSIRICFRTDSVSESAFYVQMVGTFNLLDDVEKLRNDTSVTSKTATPYAYTFNGGYIDSSGVLHSYPIDQSSYRYTNLIPVKEGEIIDTIVSGNNTMGIAAYTKSDTIIADVNKSYIVPNIVSIQNYEVPQGIAYVRICYRKTDIRDSDFYINIHHIVSIKEDVIKNRNDIENLKKSLIIYIDEIEKNTGRCFYNNSLINVGNAILKKYDVSTLERVYVTTSWKSEDAGFYMVTFLDSNNEVISSLFRNVTNETLTLTDEEVAVPAGAVYMYVNSRYNSNLPVVKVDYSSELIEEKITELSSAKEISILFIGNSLTQDAVSYVPLLLRELAPDLKFKFYIWYNGGYTLAQQLSKFNNDETCEIFSVCENGIGWGNSNNSVKMSTILSTYEFDIVCLQEYFNYQSSPDISAFNGIVEYIENNYQHPFKVVELLHAPKRSSAQSIFNDTVAGNGLILKSTVCESIIPSGIAIYRALSTDLDSLGDQGHLTPDGTHAQEGLPCMMQAYVTAMWILKQVGINMSVNNASSVVDNSNYASINVPGPNLGTGVVVGTTEQVRLSQLVAIKAFKEGEYFVNANLTEYTI